MDYINTDKDQYDPPVRGTDDPDTFFFAPGGTGAGVDIFRGRGDNDTARGGAGNDKLFGDAGNDILEGGDGDDTLNGDDGNDKLEGGDGNDILIASEGDDILVAGTGRDRLYAGSGNDTLVVPPDFLEARGSVGFDVLDFTLDVLLGGITVNIKTGDYNGNVASGIEGVAGTEMDDNITGDNGANNLFRQNGAASSNGANKLYGEGGDDTLSGLGGDDQLFGDDGSDSLTGGKGDDLLDTGGAFSSIIGDDVARGGAGNDTLTTADGDDVLNGGAGSDTAIFLHRIVNVIIDLESEGPFNIGSFATVKLVSIENIVIDPLSVRADMLSGNDANNLFDSGQGNDLLDGRGGDDTILAGDGNDTLTGGTGIDLMTGGTGGDTFVFLGVADSSDAARDHITDFLSGTDKVKLQGFVDISGGVTPGARDVTFTYIGGGSFSGLADELRFADGVLSGDSNRDGLADFAVELDGLATLLVTDLIL